MRNELKLQCFICKNTIDGDAESSLDPCLIEIETEINKDPDERRSQTFFCHYECFRKINNDDNSLYLPYISTLKEVEQEYENVEQKIDRLVEVIFERSSMLNKLFTNELGRFFRVETVIDDNEALSIAKDINDNIRDELILSWSEDIESATRSRNVDWKVVTITTLNCDYSRTFLIGV